MVRRVKRATFEHKQHQIELDYLEVERTLCILTKAYGMDLTLKLKLMAGFMNKEAFSITDEGGVIRVLEVFAPRGVMIDFIHRYKRSCSWDLFDSVCADCKYKLGSNECYEERNYIGGIFHGDRKQQLDEEYK